MSEYDIRLKTVPAMNVVSRLITIPVNAQAPELLGEAFHEVWEHIHKYDGVPAGTNLTLWHQGPEVVTHEVVETIVPVTTLLPSSDRINCYRLDAQEVVSAVHEGDFEEFAQLHPIIVQWAKDNGYALEGGYREIYLKHDPANFSDSITEVQFPLQ
ncbi:MAG: GyrI-like domain-containing protein [Anaerolineae bacterium]|jgi:effector-binding domain-containing protein|nr:GyrI-like domain-containing protein [Anaerolineae bacterium]